MGLFSTIFDKIFDKDSNGPILGAARDTAKIADLGLKVIAIILAIPLIIFAGFAQHTREVREWRAKDLANPYGEQYANTIDLSVDFNKPEVLTPDPLDSTPFHVNYHGAVTRFDIRTENNIGKELYFILPFSEQTIATEDDPKRFFVHIPKYIGGGDTSFRLVGSNPSADIRDLFDDYQNNLAEMLHDKNGRDSIVWAELDTLRGHNDPFDSLVLPRLTKATSFWPYGFAPNQIQAKSRALQIAYIKSAKILALMRFEEACIRSNIPTMSYQVVGRGTTLQFKLSPDEDYNCIYTENSNAVLFIPRLGAEYVKNKGYDENLWLASYTNSFRRGMPSFSLFLGWLGSYPGDGSSPGIVRCLTTEDWQKGPFIMGTCLGDDPYKAQKNSHNSNISDFIPFTPISRPMGQEEVLRALEQMNNQTFWESKFAADGINLNDVEKNDIRSIINVVTKTVDNEVIKANRWYPETCEIR